MVAATKIARVRPPLQLSIKGTVHHVMLLLVPVEQKVHCSSYTIYTFYKLVLQFR